MGHITVRAAYGRRYTTFDEIIQAWVSNLDFKIIGPDGMGRYINRTDFCMYSALGRLTKDLNIRFDNDTKVVVVSFTPTFNGGTRTDVLTYNDENDELQSFLPQYQTIPDHGPIATPAVGDVPRP